MIDVVSVKPVGGFRLRVGFSDGSAGVHDFSSTVARNGEMVQPLKDPAFFARVATRLSILVSDQLRRWCSCAEPSCKRARACRAPKGLCSNPKPTKKPLSERHLARSRATFARMLESMDQADLERQRPSADKSHKKS